MNVDVWDLHAAGAWVVVPTNQRTRGDGSAVMGAGLARQAVERFPGLDLDYGNALTRGSLCVAYPARRLLLVPTKRDWRQPSTLSDVAHVVTRLQRWAVDAVPERVAVPALGCGLGGLLWEQVAPVLALLPDPPFTVVPPP